jgi:proteasome lid subunit RPN8/RPN11
MQIHSTVRDAVVAHARRDAPFECCGLLLGQEGMLEEAVPAGNLRRSRTRYLIDPRDHFAALRRARQGGRVVLGAYHSHPRSAAVPSPADLEEAHDAAFLYVIVSLQDPRSPDVQAYRLAARHYAAVPLIVAP